MVLHLVNESKEKGIKALESECVFLNEEQGLRFVVWPNNVLIEKVYKENGAWKKESQFSLSKRCIEFLAARTSRFLEAWDSKTRDNPYILSKPVYYIPLNDHLGFRCQIKDGYIIFDKVKKINEHWKLRESLGIIIDGVEFLNKNCARWLKMWGECA